MAKRTKDADLQSAFWLLGSNWFFDDGSEKKGQIIRQP
jgi:hypothetical protein